MLTVRARETSSAKVGTRCPDATSSGRRGHFGRVVRLLLEAANLWVPARVHSLFFAMDFHWCLSMPIMMLWPLHAFKVLELRESWHLNSNTLSDSTYFSNVLFTTAISASQSLVLLLLLIASCASASTDPEMALFMLASAAAATVASNLYLPGIFSDGAVLQAWDEGDARAFVYGNAAPNSSVALTISSENISLPFSRTYSARSLATGRFSFQIDGTYGADPKGRRGPHYGPYSLHISSSGEERHIKSVTFGDVYICAGDEAMLAPVGDVDQPSNVASSIGSLCRRRGR